MPPVPVTVPHARFPPSSPPWPSFQRALSLEQAAAYRGTSRRASERAPLAVRDLCKVSAGNCTGAISSARREHMPQLDGREMEVIARQGWVPAAALELARRFRPSAAQAAILREICARCTDSIPRAVQVVRQAVPIAKLRPTQSEANEALVRAIARDSPSADAITRANPIVIDRDGHVIDGHHRFHAAKKRAPSGSAHVIRLDAPHHAAMRIAWALSRGAHTLAGKRARRA